MILFAGCLQIVCRLFADCLQHGLCKNRTNHKKKRHSLVYVEKKMYLCTRFRNAESTIAFFALIHKFGIAEFLPDLFPFVA